MALIHILLPMDKIQKLLQKVDKAKVEWNHLHLRDASYLAAMQQKLHALWTYHSNAIEGNTLTLGETIFFLQYGLTSEGKPLKDYLEAKNHVEAIDYLYDVVKDDRPMTEGLVKELNALLLKGIEVTQAQTSSGQKVEKKVHPGEYKKEPNHVLTLSGKIHHYVEPIHVPLEMENLLKEYSKNQKQNHPVLSAADLHYGIVRIHPFDDCNGRVARLVMNLCLMQNDYPPCIIEKEKRKQYLETLEKADRGDRSFFYQFVAESLLKTLDELS